MTNFKIYSQAPTGTLPLDLKTRALQSAPVGLARNNTTFTGHTLCGKARPEGEEFRLAQPSGLANGREGGEGKFNVARDELVGRKWLGA